MAQSKILKSRRARAVAARFICLYISLGFLLKYFLESYQIMTRMECAASASRLWNEGKYRDVSEHTDCFFCF